MRKAVKSSDRNIQIYIYLKNVLRDETGGVALILVIWVLVILVAIVGQFSYSMRTEINITRNFKEEEEAYQLALAGIELAKAEILSVPETEYMFVNENGVLVFNQEEEEPARKGNLGNGNFQYNITDEDGKLSINKASVEQLKYIFLDSGVDVTEVDTIVDSIIDWRDKNDLHMLNGAEEDFYQSLPVPYSCKDGPFDSVEELLLVKGMTPEILYGSKDREGEDVYEGVEKYFTVKGSNMVNINTASQVVLEAVVGIEAANNIFRQREYGPISRPLRGGKVSSEFFTIISTGSNSDDTIKRSIKTVLQNRVDTLEVIYWNDNFIG
jgi:general secretion pathway protein K